MLITRENLTKKIRFATKIILQKKTDVKTELHSIVRVPPVVRRVFFIKFKKSILFFFHMNLIYHTKYCLTDKVRYRRVNSIQ